MLILYGLLRNAYNINMFSFLYIRGEIVSEKPGETIFYFGKVDESSWMKISQVYELLSPTLDPYKVPRSRSTPQLGPDNLFPAKKHV